MPEHTAVRPPAVAGTFYAGTHSALRDEVNLLLAGVQPIPVKGKIKGLVSPHAGYFYSGSTAAYAYKSVRGVQYDCVVIVGPSHREYFDGVSVFPGDAYSTPLGKIPVDKDIRSELLEGGGVIAERKEGHRSEHSIEVQLPFLQAVLGEFSFVPVVMGEQNTHYCAALSEELVRIGRRHNILFIASSDLSHYHPSEEAVSIDKHTIREIEKYDPDLLISAMESGSLEACGAGPVAVVMKTAKQLGADRVHLLHYCNSGDISGDKKAVVGYLAAAFVQTD
jgi:AmmeMemoRadiSam system protein B